MLIKIWSAVLVQTYGALVPGVDYYGDSRSLRGVLRIHLSDHAHRTLTKLVGILARACHDSNPPKVGSLRKRRNGSVCGSSSAGV